MCLSDNCCFLVSQQQQQCCFPYVSSLCRYVAHSIFRITLFWRLKALPICNSCVPSLILQIAVQWFNDSLPTTFSCTAISCQANFLIYIYIYFFFPCKLYYYYYLSSLFHMIYIVFAFFFQQYYSRWTVQVIRTRKTFLFSTLSYYIQIMLISLQNHNSPVT